LLVAAVPRQMLVQVLVALLRGLPSPLALGRLPLRLAPEVRLERLAMTPFSAGKLLLVVGAATLLA